MRRQSISRIVASPWFVVACAALAGAVLAACGSSSPVAGSAAGSGGGSFDATIQVLSNRADLISGGDALVRVALPAGTSPSAVRMLLNGQDVSSEFATAADGSTMGLVTGLNLGSNVLVAQSGGASSAATTIINHPNGGPIIAGPQPQPWTCQEGAIDAQCDREPVYTYYYKSTDLLLGYLQPYNPDSPPKDVATTTTDQGLTLPFIVRVETGYQDRDQYQIAVLYQPEQPWSALQPQTQFNHKLLITHGASCNVAYETGTAPSVTSYDIFSLLEGLGVPLQDLPIEPFPDSAVYALGAGFAVMSTALDNNGHDCDVVIQAESLIMAKERVIENYGTLRYTIGTGCSGGSLAQQWIANAYPGIYQGVLPTCSFPDTWTTATQVMDYHLLNTYFGDPIPGLGGTAGVVWNLLQAAAVEGNALPIDSVISDFGFFDAIQPTQLCAGITAEEVYNPTTNVNGVRCSVADLGVNVFGQRQHDVWTANEQKLGHGFAGIAVDNTGVQYGLSALQQGVITPAMFLDLNSKIGGLSIDIAPTQQRLVADQPALANAYRSGMINETNNYDQTAIIDCRGPDPGLAHDSYRAFAVRARLDREHGSHANQLIWEGPIPIVGDVACNETSLIAMDKWLSAVEQDSGGATIAQKIVNDKPASLSDACWDGLGNQLSSQLCGSLIVPVYGTPRTVAGDAITTDANKCQLKPLNRSDNYGLIPFSDAQWTQMQTIFPDGVCDYSQPGVSQQATIAWQTYQDDSGGVVYGGQALPAAPANSGGGWASPAFGVFAPGS